MAKQKQMSRVQMQARIERLEKWFYDISEIIRRMPPLTADGTFVHKGMHLWLAVTGDGGKSWSAKRVTATDCGGFGNAVRLREEMNLWNCTSIGDNCLYASKAALEKARGIKKSRGKKAA